MRAAILALAFVSACTSARRPDDGPSWSLPDWAQGSSSGERPGSSSTGAAESTDLDDLDDLDLDLDDERRKHQRGAERIG